MMKDSQKQRVLMAARHTALLSRRTGAPACIGACREGSIHAIERNTAVELPAVGRMQIRRVRFA